MSYVLRVRPALPFPFHGGNRPIRYEGKIPIAEIKAGKVWLLLGAPITPTSNWTCDTDLVWPVLRVEGCDYRALEFCGVCRHQIEAGD
jgi:hypothetical protein